MGIFKRILGIEKVENKKPANKSIIFIPIDEDKQNKLFQSLERYRQRLDKLNLKALHADERSKRSIYQAPENQIPSERSIYQAPQPLEIDEFNQFALANTRCKIAIVTALLEQGFVKKEDAFLAVSNNDGIDLGTFDTVWDVILDYATTGGEHVQKR